MKYHFKTGLLFIFILASYSSWSQLNCNCSEYAVLQKRTANILQLAVQLQKLQNKICRAEGYWLMGRYYIDENKLDSAEHALIS